MTSILTQDYNLASDASTESEEQDAYDLDKILAEEDDEDGNPLYLVQWTGYPEWRNSWEPLESFTSKGPLADWEEEKQRISRGESYPFDLERWQEKTDRTIREVQAHRQARRERRQAKERKAVLDAPSRHDAGNYQEAQQISEEMTIDGPDSSSEEEPLVRARKRVRGHRIEPETKDIPVVRSTSQNSKVGERKGKISFQFKTPSEQNKVSTPRNSSDNNVRDKLPNRNLDLNTKLDKKALWTDLKPARKAAKGAGPTRVSKVAPRNIFANWGAEPEKRARQAAIKLFPTMRQTWRAEKMGRDERKPEPQNLVLFKPQDGRPVAQRQDVTNSNTRIGSTHLHANNDESLFITQSPSPPRDTSQERFKDEMIGLRPKGSKGLDDLSRNANTGKSDNDTEMTDAPDISKMHIGSETHIPRSAERLDNHFSPRGRPYIDPNREKTQNQAVIDFGPHTRHLRDLVNDSRRTKHIVIGSLIIGKEDHFIKCVEFAGLPNFHYFNLFLQIKEPPRDVFVRITDFCSADEYLRNYHHDGQGYYASGYIKNWNENYAKPLEPFVRAMQKDQFGGLFFSKFYTLVLFVAGSSRWGFLDHIFPSDTPDAGRLPTATMRFVFRSPIRRAESVTLKQPETSLQQTISPTVGTEERAVRMEPSPTNKRSAPQSSKEDNFVRYKPQPNTSESRESGSSKFPSEEKRQKYYDEMIDFGETHEKAFEKCFHVKWADVVPLTDKSKTVIFLYYKPDVALVEHDLFKDIFGTYMQMKTYSVSSPGEWSIMAGLPGDAHGLILFHSSVTDFHKVENLAIVLRNRNIRITQIDLNLDGSRNASYATRIFPSGGAFLLPDSLVLFQPRAVHQLLQWYRRSKISGNPRSKWKFVVRPGFREWIRKIIMEDGKQHQEQVSSYQGILLQLAYMMRENDYDENDGVTPLPSAPYATPYALLDYNHDLRTASKENLEKLQHNDSMLVRWFGTWSLEQVSKHRKFYIIFDGHGDEPTDNTCRKRWTREWCHIQTLRSTYFMQSERVKEENEKYEQARRKGSAPKSPKTSEI